MYSLNEHQQQQCQRSLCLHLVKEILLSYFYRASLWLYNRLIGLVDSVFANGPGDMGSIPGRVIRKTLKMVLATALLNTQQYKVRIKGNVEQS